MSVEISIVTPTYNRKYGIECIYKHLKKQTIDNFEWIIIDDGSNDGTDKTVENIKKNELKMNINYVYQQNQGKHVAINTALDIAKGKLFFILDSDDYIVENCIERILYWESTIKSSDIIGLCGLKGFSANNYIGTTFSDMEYIDANNFERQKYNISGDKAEIFYTERLKMYKFPVFKGEKFLSEAVVWNKIANDGWKLRWFNEIIYICEEYRSDGLTNLGMQKFKSNWEGYTLYVSQELEYRKSFIRKLNILLIYIKNLKEENKDINLYAKKLDINKNVLRLLTPLAYIYSKFIRCN